ncbi:MAG: type II secretion system protein [Firmicutes bacterium]|nr:type II secretion system protein [Bacillota bacterium]
MSGNKGDLGFTLVEVLAALVLLGMGCAVLYAGYAQANRWEEKTAREVLGLILARMQLAALEAGEETGRGGDFPGMPGYRWQAEDRGGEETGLFRLAVTVQDPKGHRTTVWTAIGRAP